MEFIECEAKLALKFERRLCVQERYKANFCSWYSICYIAETVSMWQPYFCKSAKVL